MNILKISSEFNIDLISTNDAHFTEDKDVEAHDMLLCVQTGKPFNEPGRMRYSGTEFLKSAKEMNEMYQDHGIIILLDDHPSFSYLYEIVVVVDVH